MNSIERPSEKTKRVRRLNVVRPDKLHWVGAFFYKGNEKISIDTLCRACYTPGVSQNNRDALIVEFQG